MNRIRMVMKYNYNEMYKKIGWVLLEILPKPFCVKHLDVCRNVKRNENFIYQNTFITKIKE